MFPTGLSNQEMYSTEHRIITNNEIQFYFQSKRHTLSLFRVFEHF